MIQDDDAMINEPPTQQLMDNTAKNEDMICLLIKWLNGGVIRRSIKYDVADNEALYSKHAMTIEEYSDKYYPMYCGGPCTLFSKTAINKTYEGKGLYKGAFRV